MVPAAVVILDALPLNANGKLDRLALPHPDQAANRFVAARTETEAALARIWTDVLKRDEIGMADNFLALGGHSLMAIRILGRISRAFGVRLPLRALFDAPTIEALARVVDAARLSVPATTGSSAQ
jgi:acyl carrier protein